MSTVFTDRDAIVDLRGAPIRFAGHVTDELPAIDAAIERAFDGLAQAERHWRSQIARQVAGLALRLPDPFAGAELGVDLWQAESYLDTVAEAAQVSPVPVIFAAIRTQISPCSGKRSLLCGRLSRPAHHHPGSLSAHPAE